MINLWLYIIIYPIIALLVAIAALYVYFKQNYKFWEKLKIPYVPPTFPMGSVTGVGTEVAVAEILKNLYDKTPGKPAIGYYQFQKPFLLIRDPEILKSVLIKDFMTFHDRGFYMNERDDPLSANLFGISGTKWKNLRTKISPTFTSGKMKMMFPILLECSDGLKELLKDPASRGETLEMKEICARFTTDIISSCAFGIQTDSMKNPNAIFRVMGRKIFEFNFLGNLKTMFILSWPDVAKRLRMSITSAEVTNFIVAAVKDTVEYREKNNIERKDFLQLMIQLKNKGRLDDVDVTDDQSETDDATHKFTLMDATAQAFVFFAGGFETSSTTMQFALYELAVNPDIQDRLRQEIQETIAKDNGKITYEGIHSMQYLGRVIDETLRKYPPITSLLRENNKEFLLPKTNWVIPKGVTIQVPVLALHHDPQYYPNPDKFDPDRFTEKEKASRINYTYLPFGEGPRNCIGMRFGLMQTRVGLVTIIANYRVEVSTETTVPLKIDKNSFVLAPEGGMKLKVTALK